MTNQNAEMMEAVAFTEQGCNAEIAELKAEREELLSGRIRSIEERIAELDGTIAAGRESARKAFLDEFAIDGNQHPIPGVTIQLRKKLVYSRDEAIGWCQRTDNGKFLDLKLKVRAFEKALRADAFTFPFEVEETPTAALPQDLSQYLPEVES